MKIQEIVIFSSFYSDIEKKIVHQVLGFNFTRYKRETLIFRSIMDSVMKEIYQWFYIAYVTIFSIFEKKSVFSQLRHNVKTS